MATSLVNNLFPPIIDTYMPAFVRSGPCYIYFSLSPYNSLDDILNAQVTVTNQSNNMTALSTNKYPTGIMIKEIQEDYSRTTDDKYYITIMPGDDVATFALNQFYKVQIRFTKKDDEVAAALESAISGVNNYPIANWLSLYTDYFSEWSTVCLIKGIEQPQIILKDFPNEIPEIDSSSAINNELKSQLIQCIGSLQYAANNDIEKEILNRYKIIIRTTADNNITQSEPLYESEMIYSNKFNSPNEIQYSIPLLLNDKDENGNLIQYILEFHYETNNGYTDTIDYLFTIVLDAQNIFDATLTNTVDNINGVMLLTANGGTEGASLRGSLSIKRTSDISNFTIWETIIEEKDLIINAGELYKDNIITSIVEDSENLFSTKWNYQWMDKTAESGIWYLYAIDLTTNTGTTQIVTSINPKMLDLEDMFLATAERQLKITYNPDFGSFKVNLSESRTDTIGSPYPFIRRNGNIKYKQFSIGGLISGFDSENELFISDEELYGYSKSYYDSYNKENAIFKSRDYNYEKKFRDKVMDFLYDGKVKLFKSGTEGNILVRIMDVSLTPDKTLGRLVYSFSATAYEIAECSIENYQKYNIL